MLTLTAILVVALAGFAASAVRHVPIGQVHSLYRRGKPLRLLQPGTHWVLPGLEEGRFLTGASTPEGIAAFYRERGAKLVVVKLGPAGAWFDGEHGCGTVPGFPVAEVVDTVGAGDGFAVGVVSALLEGRSVPDAVRRGCWIGARAVQVLGDTEGLPTRAQLQEAGL